MSKQKFSGIIFDRQKVSLIFLGVGITMFLLNMLSIITLLPYLEYLVQNSIAHTLTGYYISVISSIILIVYSMYNLFID